MSHSQATVAEWIRRIVKTEAGYTDDPNDSGNWTGGKRGVGELKGTKYGIAANTYPDIDIKNLTIEQAADIYIKDFLNPLSADQYEDGVAYQLLDFAINSGQHNAIKTIQKEFKCRPDGVIGPNTISAIESVSESDFIMRCIAARINFLTSLGNIWWGNYGKGVMNRMAENLRYGAVDSD